LNHALGLAPHRAGTLTIGDVDVQPDKSDVVCEQTADGLTMSVPRSRFTKGPLGYWFFALFWNGIVTAVMSAFLFLGPNEGLAERAFPLAMGAIFFALGIVALGVAIHMTIRRAEIAYAGGELLVLRYGIFGKKRDWWVREQLAAIRASGSDTKINNRQLLQLEIVPVAGKSVKLLTGRDEQELAWIATQLRKTTKLPAETADEADERNQSVVRKEPAVVDRRREEHSARDAT
jgi:hypothetical protein